MTRIKKGDTLVEVLFAFAILATIIGFSFTGALASYKSALAAQNRTQATFVAQYQADGLKTYRDSLEWDGSAGLPSFIDGFTSAFWVLPKMQQDFVDSNRDFCMQNTDYLGGGNRYWLVQSNAVSCNNIASQLAPNLDSPEIRIQLDNDTSATPDPDRRVATIIVSWLPRNTSVREQVTNTIILTRQE